MRHITVSKPGSHTIGGLFIKLFFIVMMIFALSLIVGGAVFIFQKIYESKLTMLERRIEEISEKLDRVKSYIEYENEELSSVGEAHDKLVLRFNALARFVVSLDDELQDRGYIPGIIDKSMDGQFVLQPVKDY